MTLTKTKTGISSRLIFFSILFIFLNIADVGLTQLALQNGLNEANPILAANLNFLIPAKIIGIFLVLIVAYIAEKKYNSGGAIIAPVSLTAIVVIWNIIQILKAGII